jgi:hypothetical protein
MLNFFKKSLIKFGNDFFVTKQINKEANKIICDGKIRDLRISSKCQTKCQADLT